MTTSELMDVALKAVKEAEKVIMKYFSEGVRAELKEDESPVTIADKEAEDIIIQAIKSRFPDHSFLGEESGETKEGSGEGPEYLWIIDPVDGTYNYLRGLPLFATQIALMKDGELILGVSNAPAMRELIYAEKGMGAFMDGKKVRVSEVKLLRDAYMSYGNLAYFEKLGMTDSFMPLVKGSGKSRGFGDFWSYHLLAQGKIDIMIEAKTRIWDIAACKVIVEEAGGKMTDLEGKKVSKDTTSIIATNGGLHESVSKYFS